MFPFPRFGLAVVFTGFLSATTVAAEMVTLAPAILVNDQVISALEVEMRVKLAMISSGLQDTADTREFLEGQVEQALIDEELQSQEAQRLGISVEAERVDEVFSQIANSNGMSAETLRARLKGAGILPDYLDDQIRAQILWRRILENEVLPRVTVSPEDVDDAVRRIEERQGEAQRLLAEIFLPIDNPAKTAEVTETATKVIEQMRRGASFQALARQLSQSPTAVSGGDLGWVDPGIMPEEVEKSLSGMSVGQLSDPIVTPTGVYVIFLRDSRPQPERMLTASVKMLTFAVKDFENRNAVNQAAGRATQAARALAACSDAEAVAERYNAQLDDLDKADVSSLPPGLRTATNGLPIGQASDLFRAAGGVGLAIVCDREDSGIDRGRVEERLLSEQVETLSRRYMQDLRRIATVEMRS